MSVEVEHPMLHDIKDILNQRVDFTSTEKAEYKDVIPRNYNVLVPDRQRRGSSYGSPCPSSTDRLGVVSGPSSVYESSTASSSPISITKELTSVASPMTPLSDAARSKSKSMSPTRSRVTSSFLSESSQSPARQPALVEGEQTAPSHAESVPLVNGISNGIEEKGSPSRKRERDEKREKRKKKKKSKKKRKRSPSPPFVYSKHQNSPVVERERSPSISTQSTSSDGTTSTAKETESLPNGDAKKSTDSSISPPTVNGDERVPPIRLKLGNNNKEKEISGEKEKEKEKSKHTMDTVFEQPLMKPRKLTIKMGSSTLVASRPLVAYEESDEEEGEESSEKSKPLSVNGSLLGSSSSASKDKEEERRKSLLLSPRTIIEPLKPSKEPVKKVEQSPSKSPPVIGPMLPPSTSEATPKKLERAEREKRRNSSIEDMPSSKRKRLLSERGETEAAYPVMDKTTISSWNWADFGPIRGRVRGVGLHNSSNDCFLNAILQLVAHTAPLARYVYEKHPLERCARPSNQCLCCSLASFHLKRVFAGQGPFMASWIRPHLKRIFPSHMHGMQEDAHELLSLMLDAIDPPPGHNKTAGQGAPNGINVKPSTPIEQIFGGTLRNQVTCTSCDTPYTNYERIRELNLAIRKRPDGDSIRISHLMDNYFKDESLSNFDCKKCARKTSAIRRTRVLRPPAVLLVQLKRFNAFGGKIRLPVSADLDTDLLRFLYDGSSPVSSAQYVLTCVVEHLGAGVDHGHYVCYARGFAGGQWYLFDDEMVQPVSAGKVVGSNPYLLVYSRRSDLGLSSSKSGDVIQKPMGIGSSSQHNGGSIQKSNGYKQNGYVTPNHKQNGHHNGHNGGPRNAFVNRSGGGFPGNNNGHYSKKFNNINHRRSYPQSNSKQRWRF